MKKKHPRPDRGYRNIQGMNVCCELPRSQFPWKMTMFRGSIIATNPHHPPMVINGGRAERLVTA